MLRALLLSFAALALQAQHIFVITDAEGVAGVCRQDQTDPKDAEMRSLLTGEINAAVEGFFQGGAKEVTVWDGHDGSQTLSALTIHPRARLVHGFLGATMLMERKYSGIAFIGQHARANSPGGVMAHSYSSLGIQTMLMNGREVGEIETRAALAGWFGTPVVFLSGDQVAVAQLKAIVPSAVAVAVKEGLGNYACISLSAEASRNLIRENAAASAKALPNIPPYKIEGPVTIQVETTARHTTDSRIKRYEGRNFLEAWRLYSSR